MSEHEDLNWLAFRYVAGELTAAELQAFESQLEDDQSAREAVARACELTCCIAAAEHGTTAVREANAQPRAADCIRRSSRVAWQHVSVLAVSLAVCLLLLLTTMRLPRPENGGQVGLTASRRTSRCRSARGDLECDATTS